MESNASVILSPSFLSSPRRHKEEKQKTDDIFFMEGGRGGAKGNPCFLFLCIFRSVVSVPTLHSPPNSPATSTHRMIFLQSACCFFFFYESLLCLTVGLDFHLFPLYVFILFIHYYYFFCGGSFMAWWRHRMIVYRTCIFLGNSSFFQ